MGMIEEQIEEIIERYIDDDFSLFACGETPPLKSVVDAFEERHEIYLPEEFREYSLSSYGGIYIEVKPEVWPRIEKMTVAPFWQFLYGVIVLGFSEDIPEWMDIEFQTETIQNETGQQVIPFLRVINDPNIYCFNEQAKICQWDNEEKEFSIKSGTFLSVFKREIRALRNRKDKWQVKSN